MKYLFIIGEHKDFDTENFRNFLDLMIKMEGGKPFQMFLYKFNAEIIKIEYPYLYVEGSEKKGLALYPYIILKCKDLNIENKLQFQVCIGKNFKIKQDQIQAYGFHQIIVID
jgi:hypothetical protein